MNNRQITAVLFLISIIVLYGCVSQNSQFQTQPVSQKETTVKPQSIRVSPLDVESAEPAIASGRDGNIFVVWVEHKADKTADVMLRQYDLNGQPKGESVRVNPQGGQATAWRGDPPTIAVGQDKTIYIGWTAKVESDAGQATTLYLSVSRDDGRTFDLPVKVNDDAVPAEHGMHSLAVDNAGHVFMAWLDERYLKTGSQKDTDKKAAPKDEMKMEGMEHHHKEPNREIYFAVSNDGGKSFSVNKRLAGDVCPCCKTSILPAVGKQVFVSWRQVLADDFRHIAIAASSDNGSSFSAPVIVSDDQWQLNGCPVSGAAMAQTSDNTLRVVWFTAGKAGAQGLYTTESKDGGKSFASRTLISESIVSDTPVLLSDDASKNTAVWEDNGKMKAASLQENSNTENKQELGEGSVVSAAGGGERIFISFVKKENEKSAVWLSVFNKPAA